MTNPPAPLARYVIIALLAGCVGLFGFMLSHQNTNTPSVPASSVSRPAPDLRGTDLAGIVSTPLQQLKGQPVLVNFFASWCVPCLAEHPQLLTVSKQHQIPIIGIAWKDTPQNVKQYLEKHGNPYSHVILDPEGKLALDFGIVAVPETFVVSSSRLITSHIPGVLTPDILSQVIFPAFQKAQP